MRRPRARPRGCAPVRAAAPLRARVASGPRPRRRRSRRWWSAAPVRTPPRRPRGRHAGTRAPPHSRRVPARRARRRRARSTSRRRLARIPSRGGRASRGRRGERKVKRSSVARRPWTSAETYHRADPGMRSGGFSRAKGGQSAGVACAPFTAVTPMHAREPLRAGSASLARWHVGCYSELSGGPPHEGPHENSTARSTTSHHRSMRHDQDDDYDVGRPQPPSAAALRTGRVDSGDRSSTGGQPRRRGGGRCRRRRAARPCHRRSLWRHSGRSGRRRCGGRVSESGGGGEQHVRGGGAIP